MTAPSSIPKQEEAACPSPLHWSLLHQPLSPTQANEAAARCIRCFDAPCVAACPTAIPIPEFIAAIAAGSIKHAARRIFQANPLGASCARLCPVDMLCEGACVRLKDSGEAVAIGQLQRHATDAFLDDLPAFFPPASRSASAQHIKPIAVVGAGPAGLACAHTLATHGHPVTLFEARAWPGGLSAHGVAPYKVADGIVEREIAALLRCGPITLQPNTMLGRDISLDALREHHAAVFLGVGLQGSRTIETHDAIHGALSVIEALRRNHIHPGGQQAVVIGGGMTAIDLAVELKMLGFAEVTICHRSPSLRASAKEQALARAHGVHVLLETRLKGMTAHESGGWQVTLHAPHDPDHLLRADHVFAAIGQQLLSLDEAHNAALAMLAHDEQGLILVDQHFRTTLPGVFAGGDCIAASANLTVAAVADGQRAAHAIMGYLDAMASLPPQEMEATWPT